MSGTTAISGSAADTIRTRSRSWPGSGAQAIINLSASPFTVGKQLMREQMLGQMARKYALPAADRQPGGGQ